MKNPEYFQFKLQLVSRKIHPFPSRNIKQKYVDECNHVACEKQLLRIFMLCLYQFFPCNTQWFLEYKNTSALTKPQQALVVINLIHSYCSPEGVRQNTGSPPLTRISNNMVF